MQMGFNNDVAYRGLVVHIQTEDHGLRSKKITSQVFHSGAILDSKTISYEAEVARFEDDAERDEHIRKMMKALHKQHFKKIHAGDYDEGLPLSEAEASDEAPAAAPAEPEAEPPLPPGVSPEDLGAALVPPELEGQDEIRVAGEYANMKEAYARNSRGEPLDLHPGADFEPLSSDAYNGGAPPVEEPAGEPVQRSEQRAWRGMDDDVGLASELLALLESA